METRKLRTIFYEKRFYGGPASHDFEATSIFLVKKDDKYYLEKWFDPFPGGMGESSLKGTIWLPENMINKSDDELKDYYYTHR